MIRFWDIRNGSSTHTLTHHKKGVRALVSHKLENSFCSAASDKIRFWSSQGDHLRSVHQEENIINTVALNDDNVLVTGSD